MPDPRKPTFSFIPGSWRTIAGYEAIHMIRKGQACWSAAGAKIGLLHRFILQSPRPKIFRLREGEEHASGP
jgi:hypothetical protein